MVWFFTREKEREMLMKNNRILELIKGLREREDGGVAFEFLVERILIGFDEEQFSVQLNFYLFNVFFF